jgi:hypothetical protein
MMSTRRSLPADPHAELSADDEDVLNASASDDAPEVLRSLCDRLGLMAK